METQKHTPLPWEIDTTHNDQREGYTVWAGSEIVCDVVNDQHDQARTNAEFVVRACNAHDDLLAALELADATLKRFEYGEKPYQTDDEGEQIYAQIAAAIAKATE